MIDPNHLRSLVQDCVAKHLYATAEFYADKLVTLSDYAPGDVYLLAQTYFVSRQYRRGAMLLRHHGLMDDLRFRYLAAKCLSEVQEWDELLTLLGDDTLDDDMEEEAEQRHQGLEIGIHASIHLLRGQAFEALDNRQRAIESFKAALRSDPFCEQALAALVDNHMLTNAEELELLDGLPFRPEDRWLALVYRANNPDVLAARADWLFHLGLHEEAYQLTSSILTQDPYATQALTTHLAAALQLGKKNELFLRGHKLVEEYPDSALSWFGVGCYYMASKQYEQARRFFAKATQLDKHSAHAWIAFGHAFAEQAHHMCPRDPAVSHEIGVLAYRNQQYSTAANWFSRALRLVPGGRVTPAWEVTVVNLAHAMRKQQQYEKAVQLYEQALCLNPLSSGSHTGLAYTHQLMGNSAAAVEYYHKALGLRPDDAFAAEMLGLALQDECTRFGQELEAAGDRLLLQHGACDAQQLQQMVAPMSDQELLQVAEERSLAGKCGNPLCSRPYQQQRPLYRVADASVYKTEEDCFCSKPCGSFIKQLAAQLVQPLNRVKPDDLQQRAAMASALAAALPAVVEQLGVLVPVSALDKQLQALVRSFFTPGPLPALQKRQWQLIVTLMLAALSAWRLPVLRPVFFGAGRAAGSRLGKLVVGLGSDLDKFGALLDFFELQTTNLSQHPTEVAKPTEPEAITAYKAATGEGLDQCLAVLKKAAAEKSVPPQLVEGALAYLEQKSGKPSKDISGTWRLVFGTATSFRPFQYIPVQEDFVISLSNKQCSLESVVGPFNFNIRGQIAGWDSTTGAMEFQFTAVDILLLGKQLYQVTPKTKPKTYTFFYQEQDIAAARSSTGGLALLRQ
eukprot:gene1960-2287_t